MGGIHPTRLAVLSDGLSSEFGTKGQFGSFDSQKGIKEKHEADPDMQALFMKIMNQLIRIRGDRVGTCTDFASQTDLGWKR